MRRAASAALLVASALGCDGEIRFGGAAEDAGVEGGDARAASCHADSDCPISSLHCDTASGACVACVTDEHCSATGRPRCDSALHACVECGSNQDCGNAAVCEPTARKCVHKCTQPSDCPAITPRCGELGLCIQCEDAINCPAAQHLCEQATGRCIECRSDTDCKGSKRRCDATTSRCVQCLRGSDCSPNAPVCDPASSTCVAP